MKLWDYNFVGNFFVLFSDVMNCVSYKYDN